jgi:hypothetical protein
LETTHGSQLTFAKSSSRTTLFAAGNSGAGTIRRFRFTFPVGTIFSGDEGGLVLQLTSIDTNPRIVKREIFLLIISISYASPINSFANFKYCD